MSYLSPSQIDAMLQPTKLDSYIAQFFPAWGAKRVRQRRQYAYEAAVNTRLRTSSQRLQGPEDYQAFPDRLALMRQVRDLEQNFGLWQGIIDKLTMYAFGRLRYQARTGDKARDDEYEEYLQDCFANCDLSGQHNLRKMVGLAFMARLRDGDYGLKWQRNRDQQLKLTGIEGDRIGGIYMESTSENYFQGITIDVETGVKLNYRVFYRTKADAYVNPVDVPAQDMIHVFDPRRYNQYRGVTPFAPIVNEARDLKELMEALRIGTKFENYHAAVQYTASGLPLDDPATYFTEGTQTTTQGAATTEQDIKYGKIQIAPIGSKVEFLKSDRPSGTVQSYLENLIRLMGTALNLPFGFLYSLSGLAGPGARMDSQQAQRVISLSQETMKDQVLERVKNTYLMEGFAKGVIRFTPKWKHGAWQFPPWPTIDAGRESNAGINEWRAGLRSKSQWFAEDGEDAEEQEVLMEQEARRTLIRAQAMAKEFDIPIELALTMLETKTQQGFYIANKAPEESTDPEPKREAAEMQTVKIVHEMSQQTSQPAPVVEKEDSVELDGKMTFVLPNGKTPSEHVRSHLAKLEKVAEATRTLNAAKDWRASNKDPLAWMNRSDEN